MNFGFTIATGTFEAVSNPAFIAATIAAAIMLLVCFRRRYRSAGSMVWRHGLSTVATLGLLFVMVVDSYSDVKASFHFNISRPAIELHIAPKAATSAVADNSASATAPIAR